MTAVGRKNSFLTEPGSGSAKQSDVTEGDGKHSSNPLKLEHSD